MITTRLLGKSIKAGGIGDCSLGNALFRIASVIGIATKNGYKYAFPEWIQQDYFVNKLPLLSNIEYKKHYMPKTFAGFDFGFCGFDIPDNRELWGELASWRYFEHCQELVRYYFTLKQVCEPVKDTILIHYRDFPDWAKSAYNNLDSNFYKKALKKLPNKKILVVTDNIDSAFKTIKLNCDYTSNSIIVDFYLLCQADYLIIYPSTFSWWASYLSKGVTIAPSKWYDGIFKDAPLNDFYFKNWKVI